MARIVVFDLSKRLLGLFEFKGAKQGDTLIEMRPDISSARGFVVGPRLLRKVC